MPTLLLVLLLILVAVVCLVLLLASRKPDRFVVERSLVINAPPEPIFALIDDFHNWAHWSPWEKLDPDMARRYSGPTAGVGAVYGWESKKAGAGQMTITEVQPGALVLIDLAFSKPFKADNVARFELTPEGKATRVRWTMSGKAPLMSKVMDLLIGMDKMVGGDFEKGLAAMKDRAEQPATAA
ncbi:MAG: SRPBCC family protein [Caulobacter sp.]|nr:SRPBCC family protein [Caulobacter sp.]